MSQAVAQIGRVISTAGIGSAEALNPFPKAKKDMAFKQEGNYLVHRKTKQVVRHWKGNSRGVNHG